MIERRDLRHNTQWNTIDPIMQFSYRWQHRSLFRPDKRGVVLEPFYQRRNLRIHLPDCATGLADFEFDEPFDIGGKEFGRLIEDVGAHMAGCFGPDAGLKNLVRVLNNLVNIFS
jgi:hypothetical protein